jgi:ribosome assembly protein 4
MAELSSEAKKKQRLEGNAARMEKNEAIRAASSFSSSSSSSSSALSAADMPTSMPVQFVTVEGASIGPNVDLPVAASSGQLEKLVNRLVALQKAESGAAEDDGPVPYAFYIQEREVTGSLVDAITELGLGTEGSLTITCQPLAVFRVRPVTRCGETLPGHSDAVLHVSYSPDGARLASGSGDTTVRFWNVSTATPQHTCRGHRHHVLCTAWSPDGRRFASADKTG